MSRKHKRKQRQADAKKEEKSNASSSKTHNAEKEDSFTSEEGAFNDESVQAEGGENTSLSEVKVENSPPAVVPKKTDNQVTIFFW